MSRVIPIAIANDIASGSSHLAWGIVVDRADGQRFGYCSCDTEKEIDSETTLQPGFDMRALSRTAGLAVDNTEITVIDPDDLIARDDIAAGRWDGASFEVFQFLWNNPTAGTLVHMVGRFGQIKPKGATYVIELRDIRQALQADYTAVLQEPCRWRFCDFPPSATSHCTLSPSDFTFSLEVTAVTSQSEFSDSGLVSSDDVFTGGLLTWVTGDSAGLSVKVRAYDGGTFELAEPMVFPIQVGDTATVLQGCAKTREACKAYGNVLNFGGEPDKPTVDELTSPATYD